jgi:FkbM family methyltransferase
MSFDYRQCIDFAKNYLPKNPVFFDVGCNIDPIVERDNAEWIENWNDDFTGLFLNEISSANCFAIEPLHYATFENRWGNDVRINLIKITLSDKDGTETIYYPGERHVLSSFYVQDEFNGEFLNSIEIECKKLDTLSQELGLGGIDYLKLDIEGAEYKALLGSRELLEQKKITFIQFEYGLLGGNIPSVKLIYDLLSGYGYRKILVSGREQLWTHLKVYNLSPTCQIPDLDEIYYKYFGFRVGVFVEVGAFDGESVSNTSCLADCGWEGFYIEPVKKHYLECLERHQKNNVKVSNLAIGTEEGAQKIYSSGIVSTLDPEHSEMLSYMEIFGYPQFSLEECEQVRLDTYLNQNNIPKNFDLLVVDVEGRENDVFSSFDLNEWRPKMLIVELVDDHAHFQHNKNLINSCSNLRGYIKDNGYTEVFRDHINTIFVLNDYITGNTNI